MDNAMKEAQRTAALDSPKMRLMRAAVQVNVPIMFFPSPARMVAPEGAVVHTVQAASIEPQEL